VLSHAHEALLLLFRNCPELAPGGNYEFQSEFAKKHRAEGRTEGRAEGTAHALLTLLEVRGLAMTAEQRAAVSACTDPERLDAWIRRAATAATAAEVFGA
jgi:hypothetical protein